MQEYVSDAIVLHKFPIREFDARYAFFTKRFGKVTGKATSSRKITSKLAGHLEPGIVAQVRFVERGGTQIVDALKKERSAVRFADLRLLNDMLTEGEPDEELWKELSRETFSWNAVLRVLGWDPAHASCERCGKAPAAFYIRRQEFFCAADASNFRPDELVLIDAQV